MWGRRHQYVTLSFLGIFNFTAPYLPWVLLGFSVVLGSSPVVDLLGMVAGILLKVPGCDPPALEVLNCDATVHLNSCSMEKAL